MLSRQYGCSRHRGGRIHSDETKPVLRLWNERRGCGLPARRGPIPWQEELPRSGIDQGHRFEEAASGRPARSAPGLRVFTDLVPLNLSTILFKSFFGNYQYCVDHGIYSDPTGPSSSPYECRVLRGGSWINDEFSLRCADRSINLPGNRHRTIGFRLALE
jgi:hypothetical protein